MFDGGLIESGGGAYLIPNALWYCILERQAVDWQTGLESTGVRSSINAQTCQFPSTWTRTTIQQSGLWPDLDTYALRHKLAAWAEKILFTDCKKIKYLKTWMYLWRFLYLNLSITKRIAPVGVARGWGWRGVWKRHNLYRLCTSKNHERNSQFYSLASYP